jgi:hypothetical protein
MCRCVKVFAVDCLASYMLEVVCEPIDLNYDKG